jgi:hypothetical protein
MRFATHEHLEVPPGNTIVWRYMGLDKFLDLITNSRLFFTSVNNLTDRYEMSLPTNIAKLEPGELERKGLSGSIFDENVGILDRKYQSLRKSTLVSCWSLGRDESYALWKIYLGGARAGLAIRTNISHLRDGLSSGGNIDSDEIYIGKVQYKDYLPLKDLSEFRLITTKREFYKYEEELRLFILHTHDSEGDNKLSHKTNVGKYYSVDVEKMIDQLYLSPFVGAWFGESIKQVLKKVEPRLIDRLVMSSIHDQ